MNYFYNNILQLKGDYLIKGLCEAVAEYVILQTCEVNRMVKIALLFLHVTSKLLQVTVLNLSGQFCIRLSKNFSKRFNNKSNIAMFYSLSRFS